jgi:uncharacterized membrane protein
MIDLWGYKGLRYLTYFVGFSVLFSLILFVVKGIQIFSTLQVVLGLFYLLFLPGYVLILCFFKNKDLQKIQTIGLSFVFSLILVIFVFLFTNNVLKIPIDAFYNFIIVTVIMLLLVAVKLIIVIYLDMVRKANGN